MRRRPLANTVELYVLADSISIHYGPFLKEMLADRVTYDRKRGPRGETDSLDGGEMGANTGDSYSLLGEVKLRIERGDWRPDWLLCNAGLHDVKTAPGTRDVQVPLDEYKRNLQTLIAMLDAHGTRIVWVRSTPVIEELHNIESMPFWRYDEDVRAYNAAADEIMAAAGIPMIDLYGFTKTLGGQELYEDHVHFAEPTRKLHAAYIAGFLSRLFE